MSVAIAVVKASTDVLTNLDKCVNVNVTSGGQCAIHANVDGTWHNNKAIEQLLLLPLERAVKFVAREVL